jgi:hypothetical protein
VSGPGRPPPGPWLPTAGGAAPRSRVAEGHFRRARETPLTVEGHPANLSLADGARRRQVRTIRDYGMQDRRENLQCHPGVPAIAHADRGWRHSRALCMSSLRAA